jgi:hypothetical protein
MDKDKKFEILMRKLAQCINLANELQVSWPIKVAARSVMNGHKKAFDAELALILARPKGLVQ